MDSKFDEEYNEILWRSFFIDHPNASEDDAIRFYSKIHLTEVIWMGNLEVLDALTHYYKGDKNKALDALIERRIKQARDNEMYSGSIPDSDYNLP